MAMPSIRQRRQFASSVSALLKLPLQRYPLAALFMGLMMAAGWGVLAWSGKPKWVYGSLALHAYALMFIGMLSAMVWTSVCRPESQTLPRFRSALAMVWACYLLIFALLPGAIAHACGANGLLVVGGLCLLLSTSMATGSGLRWAALVWLVPLPLGIWPNVAKEIWLALTESPLSPLLLLAVAAILMRIVWRRLMRISDGAPTLSPADLNVADLSSAADQARISQAGGIAIWMQKLQHRFSATAFDGALRALEQGRRGSTDRAIGMVLLPNTHWRGMALETLITAAFVGFIAWIFGQRASGPPPIGLVASYVGLLTALRFQQLHRATLMLRPSLVDVYLASAPRSQLAFSEAVVSALTRSLLPSTLFAVTLLAVLSLLYPQEQRWPLILGGTAGAFGSSLAGLGVVLMLLDSERPRLILGMIVLGMLGAIPTSLCVSAALYSRAPILVAALVLAGAGGFYAYARAQAIRWPIRFDGAT
ncbi:MAG: hypothetical protein AB7E72_21720 [Lysobacterales bacterium]